MWEYRNEGYSKNSPPFIKWVFFSKNVLNAVTSSLSIHCHSHFLPSLSILLWYRLLNRLQVEYHLMPLKNVHVVSKNKSLFHGICRYSWGWQRKTKSKKRAHTKNAKRNKKLQTAINNLRKKKKKETAYMNSMWKETCFCLLWSYSG